MSVQAPKRRRIFSWVAWATVGFNLAVIAGGTIVRATGSGDGCGESWPKCGDQFIPPNATVETLIEFSHRASSFFAGLGVAALFFLALWAFEKGHIVRKAATAAAVLIIVEALLGAALVLFSGVDDDISVGRMIAVSLHLANTFLLLGALTLTAWWGSGKPSPKIPISKENAKWLLIGALTLIVLGATGALNAISDAVFPADSVIDGIADEFGPTAPALLRLRVIHPIVAVFGGIFVAWIAMRQSLGQSQRVQRLSAVLAIIVLSQMFIGIANIFLLTPLAMQVIHLFVADILWIIYVVFAASVVAVEEPSQPKVATP
jgi:heme A synthase